MEYEYPFPVSHEVVNGKNVNILGVFHTARFLRRHKRFFEDFVTEQDALILEQPVGGDFWDERAHFFKGIGEFARKHDKKIYQIDPINSFIFYADLVAGILGLRLMCSGLMYNKRELSRRNFLKKLGFLGMGLSLSAGSLPGAMLIGKVDMNTVITYGVDDILTYGEIDFRNIAIAEGIERLCFEIPNLNRIGAIHGVAHWKTVQEYLKSPVKRMKRLAYLPYDVIGKKGIREYSPTSAGWELTRKF